MAEANTENGKLLDEVANEGNAHARVGGRAGPGRYDDRLRIESLDLLEGQLVVPVDNGLRPKLAQILDQVVGERVVVVEHKNHDVNLKAWLDGRQRQKA